ncbi:flotillin family protein [Allosediminivita pacifica]|uniref:Putative membrane protein YqiK n=1 Tax=Allosediminivita pacifica TaxID=1267769 RepID=A0A2T6AW61_9RHOB|nr:flotillin domain-containing protein [Allosediminivita pacifica]PTX48061.1 putative membrane protein YqiK [Allosediminivita pacifica]GGB11919.1 flotillin family protein [Allosediminivita pacifica]
MSALGWIILVLALAAIAIALAAWFYERATNEVSLVRTGVGGRRVVVDGGILAIPYFHEVSRVNMQTIRMEVVRAGDSSLITRDRMRIDVGAEFYASVVPEDGAIVRAAQTLGRRTFQPDQLKSLIDGMMVDALRAVAAQMSMDELHENRTEFVREVREALSDTLGRYGLQLDSVSLTALDQTPFASLDENNAFNAVGMRKLAEVIAKSKKERAEIEGESQVSVRRAEVEANRRKLEIELEQRRAEIAQTQEIETLMARQLTEVARSKAEAEREAAEARIAMERAIQAASLGREQAIREAEIAQAWALEIAEQDKTIKTAAKSMEESRARAEATEAKGAVVQAEEDLATLRQLAEADRRRQLALMAAQQDAEAEAARIRITVESEKLSAQTRSEIRRGEAETLRLTRQAEADGEAARITAENGRTAELAALELEKARLAALPSIIGEMVKPAEKIKGISINHVTGLGRTGSEGGAASPVDHTVDAILDMAVSLPAMKKIGDVVGVNLGSVIGEEKG